MFVLTADNPIISFSFTTKATGRKNVDSACQPRRLSESGAWLRIDHGGRARRSRLRNPHVIPPLEMFDACKLALDRAIHLYSASEAVQDSRFNNSSRRYARWLSHLSGVDIPAKNATESRKLHEDRSAWVVGPGGQRGACFGCRNNSPFRCRRSINASTGFSKWLSSCLQVGEVVRGVGQQSCP